MSQSKFSDAFREARSKGLETFYWKGKKYGTKYANEVKGYKRKYKKRQFGGILNRTRLIPRKDWSML